MLLFTGIACFSHCQNAVQPEAKTVETIKKPAACCTGKTPPRFGFKAPVVPDKNELDSPVVSGKTK